MLAGVVVALVVTRMNGRVDVAEADVAGLGGGGGGAPGSERPQLQTVAVFVRPPACVAAESTRLTVFSLDQGFGKMAKRLCMCFSVGLQILRPDRRLMTIMPDR